MLFDEVAEVYERVRPRYPGALFTDLAARVPAGASVLEVGCGPGQATRDLLRLGWRVHAVEPGAAMAARARANFAGADFSVDVDRFDDWPPRDTYDVVFSATAYHWVDAAVRWRRAATALRPGGTVALATNRTVAGGGFHELYRASADLHRRLAPEVDFGLSPDAAMLVAEIDRDTTDIGAVLEAAEPKAGHSRAGTLFDPPEVRFYQWEQAYDAVEAAALLSTYSVYLRVPADRRAALLDGITELVRDVFGGVVTRRYLAVLAVATTRGHDRDT